MLNILEYGFVVLLIKWTCIFSKLKLAMPEKINLRVERMSKNLL